MTIFIMCVGTRDPLWNKDEPYNPEEDDFDLERYTEGPVITFFENFIEERSIESIADEIIPSVIEGGI